MDLEWMEVPNEARQKLFTDDPTKSSVAEARCKTHFDRSIRYWCDVRPPSLIDRILDVSSIEIPYHIRIPIIMVDKDKEAARIKEPHHHTNANKRIGILEELGVSEEYFLKPLMDSTNDKKVSSPDWHPAVTVGLGLFVLVQLVPLLSLPSVLRSRGAPYLPTFQKRMDTMFRLLREEVRL